MKIRGKTGVLALAFLITLAAPVPAQRQIIQYFKVQSGTGFYVNRQYVITNAHVVRGCDDVEIKGAVPETKAHVQVLDEEDDLALLDAPNSPQQFAPLRFNIDDLKAGDKVLLMGYPGEEGARGVFSMAAAQIQNLQNVVGMKGKFYITDVVEHGNSGGPVFDTSGNVIGVVVAKSVLYTVNAVTQQRLSEAHVGVVIDLNTLKQFLFDHGVFTEWMGSGLRYDDSYIEDNAKTYIVNVQCRMPTSGPPTPGAENGDGQENVDGQEQQPAQDAGYGR